MTWAREPVIATMGSVVCKAVFQGDVGFQMKKHTADGYARRSSTLKCFLGCAEVFCRQEL